MAAFIIGLIGYGFAILFLLATFRCVAKCGDPYWQDGNLKLQIWTACTGLVITVMAAIITHWIIKVAL